MLLEASMSIHASIEAYRAVYGRIRASSQGPMANKLTEVEERLALENERHRILLEEIKTILNKRIGAQELSLKGQTNLVCDERDKAQKDIYLIKHELKKLNSILHSKDIKEAKSYLDNLLRNWEKLYGQ